MAQARREIQAEQEQRILSIAAIIETEMDLGWLDIVHKFDPRSGDERVICETHPDWEYRQASLLWNIECCAARTDEELTDTMIHELVHVLIDPLWSVACKVKGARRLNEFSVECVARAISAVRSNA